MDFDPSSSDEDEKPLPLPRPPQLTEPVQLVKVRALCSPELQKYIQIPPGSGMSIVYVAVNVDSGYVYVGKHEHGLQGLSLKRSRRKYHLKPPSTADTYFVRAMRKHGKEKFKWFVIWHGATSVQDAVEKMWISPAGLNSRLDTGGLGYNHREGGEGGNHSSSTIAKMKEVAGRPERRELQSTNTKAHWDSLSTEQRLARSESTRAGITNAVRKRKSENGKKQARAEAVAGMPSLEERGRATSTATWSAEQFASAQRRRDATNAAKRLKVLSELHPEAREQKQRKFDRQDRKEATRRSRAHALLKLPKYSNHGYKWCYDNHFKIQKEGVVYVEGSSGELVAQIQEQGTGSSV